MNDFFQAFHARDFSDMEIHNIFTKLKEIV